MIWSVWSSYLTLTQYCASAPNDEKQSGGPFLNAKEQKHSREVELAKSIHSQQTNNHTDSTHQRQSVTVPNNSCFLPCHRIISAGFFYDDSAWIITQPMSVSVAENLASLLQSASTDDGASIIVKDLLTDNESSTPDGD